MRLNEASVAIRPRSPWEAIDLGLLLAGRHRRLLLGSWALVTLPLYTLLTLLLWQHPTAVFVVVWWLKPAFDRLPLHILSKALFEQPPSITAAVRQWVRVLRPQLLASLTWRRFSLSRSFTLPVQQLEGLDGQARLQRMAVLRRGNQGAARWLTTVGVHLEMLLVLGFSTLLYMLTPSALEDQWDWQRLMAAAQADWLWLEHLNNLFYVLVLLVWEPLYVACGFTLYLNRRTVLEAWDIELQFRRLAQRLPPCWSWWWYSAPHCRAFLPTPNRRPPANCYRSKLPWHPRRWRPPPTASTRKARACSTRPSPARRRAMPRR
jgi:hypothetical protein